MRTQPLARRSHRHRETHRSGRAGWLRAAVLGSDDAIVSTASLMIGVAASSASSEATLVAGVAGLVAGAMSMAVGEYVSVSSQRDAEQADVERETLELEGEPKAELQELAAIYEKRGLDKALALQVAKQLTAHDELGAHLRDELGVDPSELSQAPSGGVDLRAQLRVLRAGSHSRLPRRARPRADLGDRARLAREPGRAGSSRRAPGRRSARPGRAARHPRRRPGDGGDRRGR